MGSPGSTRRAGVVAGIPADEHPAVADGVSSRRASGVGEAAPHELDVESAPQLPHSLSRIARGGSLRVMRSRRGGVRARRGRRPRTAAADRAPAPRPGGATPRRRPRARARTASRAGRPARRRWTGRSPTITPWCPGVPHQRRRRLRGLARDLGRAPRRGRHRGDERAGAGEQPAGDRVGRRRGWSRRSARPARTASAARSSPSKSKSRWKPTTTASAGPSDDA